MWPATNKAGNEKELLFTRDWWQRQYEQGAIQQSVVCPEIFPVSQKAKKEKKNNPIIISVIILKYSTVNI
ncbi:MAG: hypothetical protein ACOY3D_03645 [Candidatus Omnitrophota bacterium]